MPRDGSGLIDTNVAIGVLDKNEIIISRLRGYSEIRIPSIVIGELVYGALRSGRPNANLDRIDALASVMIVLNCGRETARQYGYLKDKLRAKGRPIPDNDLWIAAIAMELNLTLITRDAHFLEIEELSLDFIDFNE